MTNLGHQQLAQELKDLGVKEVKLGEICEIKNGGTPKRDKLEYWEGGSIAWFTVEDVRKQGRIIKKTEKSITEEGMKKSNLSLIPKYSVLLCCTASIGEYAYNEIELTTNQQFNALFPKDKYQNILNTKYLMYFLSTKKQTLQDLAGAGTIAFCSIAKLANIKIPLPPIEVQKVVVEILDTFYNNLSLLDKEKGQRQTQYEYYRDFLVSYNATMGGGSQVILNKLLDFFGLSLFQQQFDTNIQEVKLETLVNIETGKHNANAMVEDGKYNFYTCSKEPFKINTYRWNTEALIVPGNGDLGTVFHYNGMFDAYQRTYVLTKKNSNINLKYLFYSLKNCLIKELNKSKKNGILEYIVISQLNNITIPLPSIEIQNTIVKILDDFYNNIGEINNEIELRQKQYEYYRNQLLTYDTIGGGGKNQTIIKLLAFFLINKPFELHTEQNNEYSLGEICEIKSGGTPNRDKSEYWEGGSIAWFKSGDINNNSNLMSCDECITQEGVDNSSAKLFPKGTLLMTMYRATAGRVAITGIDGTFNQAISAIIPKDNTIISNKYLFYYLINIRDKLLYDLGDKYGIGNEYIKNIKITLPPLPIQKAIVQVLDIMYNNISSISDEINLREQQYQYYRDSLLK